MIKSRFIVLSALALLIGSAVASPAAQASVIQPSAMPQRARTTTIHRVNSDCLTAVTTANKSLAPGSRRNVNVCDRTITVEESPSTILSPAQIAARPSAPTSLVAAAAAGSTVYYKSFVEHIYQGTDEETQSGVFLYDGSKAWVEASYRGWYGSHDCWVDYAVGYSISVTNCDGDTNVASSVYPHMRLQVNLLGGFIPIQWSENYTTTLTNTGRIIY